MHSFLVNVVEEGNKEQATLTGLLELQAHIGLSERGIPSFLENVSPPVRAAIFQNFLSFS